MKRFLFLVMFVFMAVMIYVSVHEREDEMPLPQKLKAGVNATLHRLESDAIGLPDTLGLLADGSCFSFARFYVEPRLTYKAHNIHLELTPSAEYLYEKYSKDDGHHQMLFSPDISMRW